MDTSLINHPEYYGGEDNVYETIKVIDAWDLNFCLGNAVKYISRAGKKDPLTKKQDLEKAIWYLCHEIDQIPEPVTHSTPLGELTATNPNVREF